MKRKIILLAIAAFAATLSAQNTMLVKRVAAGDTSFPLASLGKITFTATDMVVSGAGASIPISDIAKIVFSDVAVKVTQPSGKTSSFPKDLLAFQSALKIVVSFNLNLPGKASISVSNSKGQIVKTIFSGQAVAGAHTVFWSKDNENGNPVPAGMYVIHAMLNGKQTTIKQLVIQ